MAPKRQRANRSANSTPSSRNSTPSSHNTPSEPQSSPLAPPLEEEPPAPPIDDDDAPMRQTATAADDPLMEEDDGEELIGEGMEADYRPMGALDEYEEEGIDRADYDEIDPTSRAAVEAMLDARDQRERPAARLPTALLDGDDDDEAARPRRRRREEPEDEEAAGLGLEAFLDEEGTDINLEDYTGPLAEWIATPAVSDEVKRRFKRFLTSFEWESASTAESQQSSGASAAAAPQLVTSRYSHRVRSMCRENRESLEVSYLHLSQDVPILAIWVADAPKEMLQLFDEAAMDVVKIMFPVYDEIHQTIHVRITDLPIQDSIRDLRQAHMGCLVKVSGVVTRRSSVFPQLKVSKYNCKACGYVLGPFSVSGPEPKMGGTQCPSCQKKGQFELNHEQTVYCNYQKVTLQESPGSVPPGRLPRHKEVTLAWDLIDLVRPGEEIEVTGVYNTEFDASLNRASGFPVFSTAVEANHVAKKEETDRRSLTDDDKREILRLARDPQIRQKIINSMAPSIFGHENIKTSLALSMFGGVGKDVNGKHRIRGDINVLLLGDPGVAKSQFLKYVEKTAPRAVYTTGQGATAVGLTASVHREPVTREWTLEGGALVLADKGVCLIDEFDKMNDSDRTSIHEAMEQQSISISKAGIIATLRARCAVIAAANPLKGKYDDRVAFSDNVDLTEPILSRFDSICVVRDKFDPIADERLADFVVRSHKKCHPRAQETGDYVRAAAEAPKKTQIDQDLLRKYITYARDNVRPVLQDVDAGKITQVYAELRQASSASGGVVVAVRHIESLIRMAEASARMCLRATVNDEDIDLAIKTLLGSVIDSQKSAVRPALERKFRKYISAASDRYQLLVFELRRLYQREAELHAYRRVGRLPAAVEAEQLEAFARQLSISDLEPFYNFDGFARDGPFSFARTTDVDGRMVIVRETDKARYDEGVREQLEAAADAEGAPEPVAA